MDGQGVPAAHLNDACEKEAERGESRLTPLDLIVRQICVAYFHDIIRDGLMSMMAVMKSQ